MRYRKFLIDILFISLIIYFVSNTSGFYSGLFSIVKGILLPILLSLFFAFSLYPIYKLFLKYFNKCISFIFVVVCFFFIFFLMFYYSIPFIYNELSDIIYSIDNSIFIYIRDYFISIFDINIISRSLSFISSFFLILFLTMYLLFYFDKFILFVKSLFNEKYHLLLSNIYNDLINYFKGFYILIIIEVIEYLIIYYIIGHPLFLILALLAGFTTIIPYLGALFTNIIALLSALTISNELFIATGIVMIIVPIFNNYVVDPKVYSNTIKISVIGIIISMIVFSNFFGIYGIIFSIPMYIVFKNFIKFLFPKFDKL